MQVRLWTDCIMGKILKKVVYHHSIEEHPKISKIAKFDCETLSNVGNVSL